MDDEENGLFNIQISDHSSDERETKEAKEARRTGQTEEAWKAVQRGYRPKVENGDIHKNIKVPIGPGASKQELQEVLHAVEEMYFFRRYDTAVQFVSNILDNSNDIDAETRQLLHTYQEKCRKKLTSQVSNHTRHSPS